MKSTRPILLVEDDDVDVMAVRRAFRELGIFNTLEVAPDGEAALAHLEDVQSPQLPCIIISDINMPRMSGIELLRNLKAAPRTKHIPVIMLTTSAEERDRRACFEHGTAGYMVKPVAYERFVELMRVVSTYWSTSQLPE